MRVLHIVPSFYPAIHHGGPIYSLYNLCNGLAQQGVDLRVLTTDASGPGKRVPVHGFPAVTPLGYPVYFCRKWWSESVAPGMLWYMVDLIWWAEIVHLTAVYSFPTIPALLLCRVFNKPLVWSPRGSLIRWGKSRRVGVKTIWEWICRLVASKRLVLHMASDDEAEQSLKRFPGREITIIPNSVDIPCNVTPVHKDGLVRLLYLGRIDPIKGIDNLIGACKMLTINSSLLWSLTIAGTGDKRYLQTIRAQIEALGLSQHTEIVGEIIGEAKKKLFENTDVTVIPSHSESFGMVVAEALAHGIPVIASRGAPWQRLEEMGCGLWVDNDPKSLAGAIEKISRMPLREMGQRGRQWMEREFSWHHRAKEMIDVYLNLINRH